ncbi:MAG: glycosyltransferase family 2 protein, partial [Fusobacterium sp.]
MEKIKVSVIIPVYNVEKYIRQCLESVINQTLKDIEIIVVNDGTKDNSMKIVEKYVSDKRIKIINKENGGISSARNAGMEIAQGEYIYFIDSDDFVDKEVLSTLYKNSENGKMDIVFSNFSYYSDRTKKEKRAKFIFPFKENINKGYYYLYNGEEINVWNRLYKKEFLEKYNFKFIEGIIYEDQDFGFRTIMLAEKIKYVENYGYKYRTD